MLPQEMKPHKMAFGRFSAHKCATPEIVECRRLACQNAGRCVRLDAAQQHKSDYWLCKFRKSVWRGLCFVVWPFQLVETGASIKPALGVPPALDWAGNNDIPTRSLSHMIDHTSVDGGTPSSLFRFVFAFMVTFAAFAAGMAFLLPTKARAQNIQAYAGVHGGYSQAVMSAADASVPGVSIEGLGMRGFAGGVHGGLDMQLPSSMFFVGAFADYTWQKVDFTINPIATVRLGDSYTGGLRTGFKLAKTKYYAGIGYTHAELTSNIPSAVLPSLHGLTYKVGTSYELAPNLLLGAEAQYTHFNNATMDTTSLKADQVSFMATMSIQLGSLASPVLPAPLK